MKNEINKIANSRLRLCCQAGVLCCQVTRALDAMALLYEGLGSCHIALVAKLALRKDDTHNTGVNTTTTMLSKVDVQTSVGGSTQLMSRKF